MEITPDESRTVDQVREVLHLAKLIENDVLPVHQAIYFTESNLHNTDYKLLQVDNNFLKEVYSGQKLYIKGSPEENAVLCSDTKTFDLNDTETSNSLLLVNSMNFMDNVKESTEPKIHEVKVCRIFYNYLEVIPGKPYFKKLTNLLENSVYKGPEYESLVKEANLLSFDELNEQVQASREELKKAMEKMCIVTVNNKIRLLDLEYHFRVLSYMLKLIEENTWELDEIDFEVTTDLLKELVPYDIVNSIFDKYAEESKIIDGLQLYRYNEEKVCKFFAEVLLSQAGKFNLDEFIQAWGESVPEGMVIQEEWLYGIAIIDRNAKPNIIWYFPENKLPENINDRFRVIFENKEKWTVPEVAPYIKSLCTEKLDVNALLAKYARASKIDGVKYYSAKHAK